MNRKSEIESIAFLSPFKFLQCPIDLSIEIFKKQKTKTATSTFIHLIIRVWMLSLVSVWHHIQYEFRMKD